MRRARQRLVAIFHYRECDWDAGNIRFRRRTASDLRLKGPLALAWTRRCATSRDEPPRLAVLERQSGQGMVEYALILVLGG